MFINYNYKEVYMNNLLLATIILIFFTTNVKADDNILGLNLSLASVNKKESKKEVFSNIDLNNNVEASIFINSMFKAPILKNIMAGIGYGQQASNTMYNNYYLEIGYAMIDYSVLTFYLGYDIIGVYDVTRFNGIGEQEKIVSESKTKHFYTGVVLGMDLSIYEAYFGFFEYKKSYLYNKNVVDSLVIGIRYKFKIKDIKFLPKYEVN
jgi:hypothetical protein